MKINKLNKRKRKKGKEKRKKEREKNWMRRMQEKKNFQAQILAKCKRKNENSGHVGKINK